MIQRTELAGAGGCSRVGEAPAVRRTRCAAGGAVRALVKRAVELCAGGTRAVGLHAREHADRAARAERTSGAGVGSSENTVANRRTTGVGEASGLVRLA